MKNWVPRMIGGEMSAHEAGIGARKWVLVAGFQAVFAIGAWRL